MMPSDYLALQEASKAQILREAAAGWGSVVDRTEYLYDDSSFGYSRSLPFTSADDRRGGAFRPVYYTETDLAAIRAQVRNLWGITPIPNGVVETLANYTFGTGIGYTVQSEVDNPRLLTAIQKTIDQFVKDHGLDGDMDREIHRRTREDGEAFVRLRWIDGRVNAQFIEPDCVTEPGNPLSVEEYCGLDAGGCWKFGVHTDSDDTSNVRGYYVYWGESDRDWEYVPECRMGHFKRNVTASAKRGYSDFYDVISDLYNEARLTGNATSGAALQAAIAWIRQTPAGTTSSQAATLGGTSPVRTASRPVAGGGTALTNVGRYAPNTVLTVPAGSEYKPGPLGAERNAGFDLIGQRVLKRCGVRWSMPEGMISGDASNNNYASALVAQSPFVKGRQADQTWYGKRTISLLWKVIRLAWEHGRFDRYGVSIEQMMEHCDITASYPTVENMDPLQQVQVQKAQRELGILSLTTAAKQAGYDLEEEQRLGAKAPEPAPQMPPGMMPGQMHPAMLAQQSKLQAAADPAAPVEVPESALECGTDMRQAVAIALESAGTTAEARAILEALLEFDESKVNRQPSGSDKGGEFAPKGGGRFPASKMPKDMTGRVDLVDDNTGEILMSDDAEVIRQAVRDSIAGGDDMSGLHVRPEDSKAAAKYEEDRKAAEAKREAEREARRKADELGNKPGGSQWVAPPEKIYHATFAADSILKDGFKTADQLGSGSDVLGGSNRGNVSFTTLENARAYRDGLSVARDAAQGRIDPDDAKRMQEIGKQFGVSPDRMKSIVADSGDAPKEKRMFRILQRVSLEGQKFPLFMGTDWSKTVQSAAVPRILEIPSSGPKEYSYVKSETEWRIGDPHKITSIKRVE